MARAHSIAQMKYDSTHCRAYNFKFNLVNDSDVIDRLEQEETKQGYIKQLIRQDIVRTGSVPGKNTVSVPFTPAAISILTEKASEKGISVPDLVALIVNEQLLRT